MSLARFAQVPLDLHIHDLCVEYVQLGNLGKFGHKMPKCQLHRSIDSKLLYVIELLYLPIDSCEMETLVL